MAYKLLAEMRVALFAKLEALAPAYLLDRRAGDLVALATQDVETIEYFYAHTVAPAVCRGCWCRATVLGALAVADWRLGAGAGCRSWPGRCWPRCFARATIDRLGAEARGGAGAAGGACDGDGAGDFGPAGVPGGGARGGRTSQAADGERTGRPG